MIAAVDPNQEIICLQPDASSYISQYMTKFLSNHVLSEIYKSEYISLKLFQTSGVMFDHQFKDYYYSIHSLLYRQYVAYKN